MNASRITLLMLAATLWLTACVPNQTKETKTVVAELKPVTINDEYTMSVPENMSKASSLNEGASLQYQNIFKETYVIVIDEAKDEYIEAYKELSVYDTTRSVISNYTETQIQSTTSAMEVVNKSEVSSFKVNGLNAKSIEIDGKVEGVDATIAYFLTFVEGRNNKLYFIMAWTLQDQKDKHRDTYKQMVKTFREL